MCATNTSCVRVCVCACVRVSSGVPEGMRARYFFCALVRYSLAKNKRQDEDSDDEDEDEERKEEEKAAAAAGKSFVV
jgi:hypothetical protein